MNKVDPQSSNIVCIMREYARIEDIIANTVHRIQSTRTEIDAMPQAVMHSQIITELTWYLGKKAGIEMVFEYLGMDTKGVLAEARKTSHF